MAQVLYRKWRPQLLAEIIGQGHVTKTLRQAVLQGRIAHAYLFCGPRGTGKTSTARILAKAAICTYSDEGEPCNKCHLCISVSEGRSLDLIEIDAASHRGIDDIRSLREKVYFTPAESTYKVYIVDEVHMMTPDAFNALLKTLEEPPSHAIFILATTEIHKVPSTVISRCHRFDFHRISQEDIESRLDHICRAESIGTELGVLRTISRHAVGSLRDAENILEQLMIAGNASISMEQVGELLGLRDYELILPFVGHLLRMEIQDSLRVINEAAENGLDLRRFYRQIMDHLRGVLLLNIGVGETLDYEQEALDNLKAFARAVSRDRILQIIRVFERAEQSRDGPATLFLEMAVVECCSIYTEVDTAVNPSDHQIQVGENLPNTKFVESVVDPGRHIDNMNTTVVDEGDLNAVGHLSGSNSGSTSASEDNVDTNISLPSYEVTVETVSDIGGYDKKDRPEKSALSDADWNSIRKLTKGLKPVKFDVSALLLDCVERYTESDDLILIFKNRANLERLESEIANPSGRNLMNDAIAKVTGINYQVKLRLLDKDNTNGGASVGHLVRAARAMGAKIVEEAIEGENMK